jgi:hypothetical protein
MGELENICPYEGCTRKTTCRTRDFRNCPIYQEYDLHKELFPKEWDVETIYELTSKSILSKLGGGESISGRKL